MRTSLPGLLLLALCGACASTGAPDPGLPTETPDHDLVLRILEDQSRPPEDPNLMMNALERLMPAWQSAQRRGRAAPIERELTRRVVGNLDTLLDRLAEGPHERRVVAAWALGFARVPDNDLGLASPRHRAQQALSASLDEAPDDLLRNALLGLWKLADPSTPLRPLTDLVIHHHDADVRSNACLALGAVLTADNAPDATQALLVALDDPEPRVRLHAADAALRFPMPAITAQLQSSVRDEQTPLVLAAMLRALGRAGDRSTAPLLLLLLENTRQVVAESAHLALIDIYGVDRGPRRSDWEALIAP